MMNFACLNDEELSDQLIGVLEDKRLSDDNAIIALFSVCAERIRNKTKIHIPSEFDAQISSAILERIGTAAREANAEADKLKSKLLEIDNMRPHFEIRIDAPKPGCLHSPFQNTPKITPKRVKGGIR